LGGLTSFNESRLELFMTKWQVVVSFDTLILQNGAGAEIRYSRIVEPRYSFSASDMILTKDEFIYLKGFFEARKGKYEGFRFANPLDYKTSGVEVELAPDVTTQGVLIETATAGEYQLAKRYTVAGVNCYKTIRKVKAGTTVFYSGGSPTSGPTIDLNSGIVTGGSAGLTVECEYDLPVRFDLDEIELELLTMESAEYGSYDAYRVIGLQLVEDNYPKVYGYTEADFTDLIYTFEPSPLPEVTKGTSTVTRIESSQSKKEARITLSGNKAIYKFGDNALYQKEVDLFCALFNACKGRKLGFTYDGVGVRFASDNLTAQLELSLGEQSVWQLSGLEVVATELALAPPPPPDPIEHIEDFSYFSPQPAEIGTTWSFTFTTTNVSVPETAQIYLVKGLWDSQGTIGSFTTPSLTPGTLFQYAYNWEDVGTALYETGPDVLIGTGSTVSGTAIENDPQNLGPFSGASCQVRLKFVWLP
jgi:uncharacterized protein (TIGR02217 family)